MGFLSMSYCDIKMLLLLTVVVHLLEGESLGFLETKWVSDRLVHSLWGATVHTGSVSFTSPVSAWASLLRYLMGAWSLKEHSLVSLARGYMALSGVH